MENGILGILQQGGFAIYPLVLCSILGVAIFFERSFFLLKGTNTLKSFHPQIINLIEQNQISQAKQLSRNLFLGRIFQKGLDIKEASEERILKTLDRVRLEEIQNLRSRVWILGTIGSLAPFIGLFGTVVGIMRAFGEIARTQEGGFSTVSAGISEALIATAAGIFVGVLSVAAYNFFSNQINQISIKLKFCAEELAQLFASANMLKEEPVLAKRK